MDSGTECTLHKFADAITRRVCCHPEWAQYAGEMCKQEPHEAQQREMPFILASVDKHHHALVSH